MGYLSKHVSQYLLPKVANGLSFEDQHVCLSVLHNLWKKQRNSKE